MTIVRDELHESFERSKTFECSLVGAIDVDDTWYQRKRSAHEIVYSEVRNDVRFNLLFKHDASDALQTWRS